MIGGLVGARGLGGIVFVFQADRDGITLDLKIAAVRAAGLRFEIDPDIDLAYLDPDCPELFNAARPRRASLPAPASRAMKSSGAKMAGN